MDKQLSKVSLEIKWKKDVPIQIIEKSQQILKYYAGKLEEQDLRRQSIEQFIRHFYPEEMQLYFALLQSIETWKIYWYFSPLYRSVPELLTHLTPINFPHLTKIVINQSNLYSIEQLAWLNCPFLREIDIEENYIVSLKPLSKTNFPELIVLKFYYNNVNHGQNECISRTKWNNFHPLGLYHFWKDFFYDHYFKFQPQLLKKIFVEKAKNQTLNNEKVISKLKDKFIVQDFFVHFSKQ